MFNPGTTGDVGAFIAIHAGGGNTFDEVWEIEKYPRKFGSWGTFESATLSNFTICLAYRTRFLSQPRLCFSAVHWLDWASFVVAERPKLTSSYLEAALT